MASGGVSPTGSTVFLSLSRVEFEDLYDFVDQASLLNSGRGRTPDPADYDSLPATLTMLRELNDALHPDPKD